MNCYRLGNGQNQIPKIWPQNENVRSNKIFPKRLNCITFQLLKITNFIYKKKIRKGQVFEKLKDLN